MTIRYLVCIVSVLKSGLPQDAVPGAGSKIVFQMTSNRHSPRFCRMLVLLVAAFLSNHDPAVTLDYTLNFTYRHELPLLGRTTELLMTACRS